MLLSDQAQRWFPTHVQVTVLQARELLAKGKSGSNDAYTLIQLGREKYSTSVAEKSLSPVWKEEASFELPGLLGQYVLQLMVLHRSLVGLDKFLGQVCISLNDIFEDKERRKTQWFKLESKPGKKPKERGEIKVIIQFMRNNMTASMFDLSMKDKTRSPFAKLKDKMKGRKNDGTISDTSSAIIPSTRNPDASTRAPSADVQVKPQPKKPFLLGPQRLSSAHSMSDLMGPHPSKAGAGSQTHLTQHPLDSFSVEESGTVKSPHRRTLSADTAKVGVPENSSDECISPFGLQSDPFPNPSISISQKFATLPRQRNPFEDDGRSWDCSQDMVSKPVEPKKKEKVSLFERVTGKKDGKKSEKVHNGGSEGWRDLQSPSTTGEKLPEGVDYEPTNPFAANFRLTSAMAGFNKKSANSEDRGTTAANDRQRRTEQVFQKNWHGHKNRDPSTLDSTAMYRNLTYEEVLHELVRQRELVKKKDSHIRELEDYIDNLLVRVMEETPSILRVPYEPSRRAGKYS
ncbi:rab11 family-interacting protein 2 [Microcaecilia unicolor]|uniref:Rab11 family-interacting protein 2 n=1 Tax=Microcaecilia unicolor TaxID=1415580 RepID=A0A6P7Y6X8_9AMPH|nr:rab11 family-interacting protein 2 [Microcaecilia unicolor]